MCIISINIQSKKCAWPQEQTQVSINNVSMHVLLILSQALYFVPISIKDTTCDIWDVDHSREDIHYKAPWAQFLAVDGSDTLIRKISNINTPNNITLLHNICSLFIINIIPIRAVSVYKHLFFASCMGGRSRICLWLIGDDRRFHMRICQ